MRYLKRFEKFDLGNFSEDDENEEGIDDFNHIEDIENSDEEIEDDSTDEEGNDTEMKKKIWGDDLVE